jgi:hypothetical protein
MKPKSGTACCADTTAKTGIFRKCLTEKDVDIRTTFGLGPKDSEKERRNREYMPLRAGE